MVPKVVIPAEGDGIARIAKVTKVRRVAFLDFLPDSVLSQNPTQAVVDPHFLVKNHQNDHFSSFTPPSREQNNCLLRLFLAAGGGSGLPETGVEEGAESDGMTRIAKVTKVAKVAILDFQPGREPTLFLGLDTACRLPGLSPPAAPVPCLALPCPCTPPSQHYPALCTPLSCTSSSSCPLGVYGAVVWKRVIGPGYRSEPWSRRRNYIFFPEAQNGYLRI